MPPPFFHGNNTYKLCGLKKVDSTMDGGRLFE
jgi:hypothetical protein